MQGGDRPCEKEPNSAASLDGIQEIMAQAYGIYNAFLAPGSPCELNIDHQLRNNLATRMTKAVGQDVTMIDTLHEGSLRRCSERCLQADGKRKLTLPTQ